MIPDRILNKYIEVEKVKSNQNILSEKHYTLVQKEETELNKKLTEAERDLDVIKIQLQKELERKKSDLELANVSNNIFKANELTK